jgi:hypothetical protein
VPPKRDGPPVDVEAPKVVPNPKLVEGADVPRPVLPNVDDGIPNVLETGVVPKPPSDVPNPVVLVPKPNPVVGCPNPKNIIVHLSNILYGSLHCSGHFIKKKKVQNFPLETCFFLNISRNFTTGDIFAQKTQIKLLDSLIKIMLMLINSICNTFNISKTVVFNNHYILVTDNTLPNIMLEISRISIKYQESLIIKNAVLPNIIF